MGTIVEKQSKIGTDNEELGLPLKQTDTDYHNADGDTVATLQDRAAGCWSVASSLRSVGG